MVKNIMKNVDIICPLYNAEKYIEDLHKSLSKQKNVKINNIKYILTESNDNTERYLINNNINYKKINLSDFSHSYTRECAAFDSESEIIVFITQDIQIESDNWLFYLVKDIDESNIVATYSRQISKYDNIEKYTREFNYPNKSKIVSKQDIKDLGLKIFFFSDASSAVNTNVFKKLNGYDHKRLPISEDMYLAYKIIISGYKIKYCADSEVYHSHNFSLKEIYDRYKLTGKFFLENSYLDQYGTTESGTKLAKYIFKRIIQEHKFNLLIRYPFDMAARLFGMKEGKK